MKEITKMSRLSSELEKAFRLLNQDFFGNALETPIITVIPSAKAYAHYTTAPIWSNKNKYQHEINIAAGTLNRPIENIFSSLLHEMVHFYCDTVINEQDTSNNGVYHNKIFKREAEAHGLNVTRSEKYGWTITEPGDDLIEWLCEHDDFREIEINRADVSLGNAGTGRHTINGIPTVGTSTVSHTIKYLCPCCGNSVRATKALNVICGDCLETMNPA